MSPVEDARRHVPKLKDGKAQQDVHKALDLLQQHLDYWKKEGRHV